MNHEHECGEDCKEPGHHAFPGLTTHDVVQPALDALAVPVVLSGPPTSVLDLAEACVRFVTAMLGKLAGKVDPDLSPDFTPETLSLIDYYVTESRRTLADRPEALPLSANLVGAYLGEVIRRQHRCWWYTDDGDPSGWRLDFEAVMLSFYPMQVAHGLLAPDEKSEDQFSGFDLREEDRDQVFSRLQELPPVSEDEFLLPSLRLEVLDIAIETLIAKKVDDPYAKRALLAEDYE